MALNKERIAELEARKGVVEAEFKFQQRMLDYTRNEAERLNGQVIQVKQGLEELRKEFTKISEQIHEETLKQNLPEQPKKEVNKANQ